jgi:hypothetical protein
VRRERYHRDTPYRKKLKKNFRRYYRNHLQKDVAVDRREIVDGQGRKFLSIGKVADLINRKPETLRKYHNDSFLPTPKFYDTRGWRLYSKPQAELLMTAFKLFDNGKLKSLTEVGIYVRKGWNDGEDQEDN